MIKNSLGKSSSRLVQDNVEFASNSSASDADDTSSFAYGPGGSYFPSSAFLNERLKLVRFLTPIKADDQLIIEVKCGADDIWHPLLAQDRDTGLQPFTYQGSNVYGIGITQRNTGRAATDVEVFLGRYYYASGATYAAAGSNWSATTGTWSWRVRKTSFTNIA